MKFINVYSKKVADQLADEGDCFYMLQEVNGQTVYSFVENDELYRLLKDKKRYSKKDYFVGTRIRF